MILDKLRWLELGRHNDLREIDQAIQNDTPLGAKALYDMYILNQGLHLTFNLTIARLLGLIHSRI